MVACYAVLFSCFFQDFLHLTKLFYNSEAVVQRCSVKKVFLEISQNSLEKQVCQSMPQAWTFIQKEALALVFPCEFCEFSKNTFSYKTAPVAASDNCVILN